MPVLTHIQLPDEAGHVVVLVVQRQQLAGKLGLILDDETVAILWVDNVKKMKY